MKRIVLLSVLVLGLSFSAVSVGYVDTVEVLQSYNKAIAAQADLIQKQQDVQDFFVKKQKEYESQIRQDSTEQEILSIKKNLESEVEPKRQELMELNKKLSAEIESDIITATDKVAQQLRLEVVLDKKSVLTGGMDITSLVINRLNNKVK